MNHMQNTSFVALPHEILIEIILYLPQKSQTKVVTNSLLSLFQFCDIVTHNDAAAESVKCLCLNLVSGKDNTFSVNSRTLSNQQRLVRSALRKTSSHVIELVVKCDVPKDFASYVPNRFPNLRSYTNSDRIVKPDTIDFIRNNPHIRNICLIGKPEDSLLQQRFIDLPDLWDLTASPHLMQILIPESKMSDLTWLITPLYPKRKLNAAYLMPACCSESRIRSMRFLCALIPRWLLPSIPLDLYPDITSVLFGCIWPQTDFQNIVFEGMNEILPQIKNLESLEILPRTKASLTNESFDEELQQLRTWSTLSTSLCQVRMPSTIFVLPSPWRALWMRANRNGYIWVHQSYAHAISLWPVERPEYKQLLEGLLAAEKDGMSKELLKWILMLVSGPSCSGEIFEPVPSPQSNDDPFLWEGLDM
ncbi:hypothetical protein BDQ17DRAFT_1432594 [Cyathus striatus]|nr:hypothetical protein BDQ17DRAFT_1432594 [Cyathus striatus]